MNAIELPLIFAAAAFIGLGGLSLLIVAAFSSIAELLALLPGRGVSTGGEMRTQGGHEALPAGQQSYTHEVAATILGRQHGVDSFRGRSDGGGGVDPSERVGRQAVDSGIGRTADAGSRAASPW